MREPFVRRCDRLLVVGLLFLAIPALALGQPTRNKAGELPPVNVEVVSQPESPLVISFESAYKYSDGLSLDHYIVHYSVQNLSQKNMRASVVKYDGNHGWGSVTVSNMSFVPGEIMQEELWVGANESLKNRAFLLAVDFVLFTDGTTWGKDELGISKKIYAFQEGKIAAVKRSKELLANRDAIGFKSFFDLEPTDAKAGDKGSPVDESLRREFIRGYKFAASRIQERFEEKGFDAVADRIADLEK